MKFVDRSGHRIGRLSVLSRAPNHGYKVYWLCRCVCGKEVERAASNLSRHQEKQSCGCLQKETLAAQLRKRNTRHGHCAGRGPGGRSPTYGSWRAMVYRCHSPSDSSYAKYGAKGVMVCARWRKNFENFLADMGERPNGTTLDRIDNTKGYEPGNVRWATATTQQNNRSCTQFIEFEGRRLSIGQWATERGIPFGALAQRIKMGWTAERALTEPVRAIKR